VRFENCLAENASCSHGRPNRPNTVGSLESFSDALLCTIVADLLAMCHVQSAHRLPGSRDAGVEAKGRICKYVLVPLLCCIGTSPTMMCRSLFVCSWLSSFCSMSAMQSLQRPDGEQVKRDVCVCVYYHEQGSCMLDLNVAFFDQNLSIFWFVEFSIILATGLSVLCAKKKEG
jgi:hypothetical protein